MAEYVKKPKSVACPAKEAISTLTMRPTRSVAHTLVFIFEHLHHQDDHRNRNYKEKDEEIEHKVTCYCWIDARTHRGLFHEESYRDAVDVEEVYHSSLRG